MSRVEGGEGVVELVVRGEEDGSEWLYPAIQIALVDQSVVHIDHDVFGCSLLGLGVVGDADQTDVLHLLEEQGHLIHRPLVVSEGTEPLVVRPGQVLEHSLVMLHAW